MIHVVLLVALIVASATSYGATYKFSSDQGRVSFLAKGRPALISINGMGQGLSGDLVEKNGRLSGELTFQVESLKTGIDLRDEHMKTKYLQIDQFPKATLKIADMGLPKANEKVTFSATVTIHGIDQTVTGELTLSDTGTERKIMAELPIKLSKFKIDIPSFQGITVAEDVLIKVDSKVTRVE